MTTTTTTNKNVKNATKPGLAAATSVALQIAGAKQAPVESTKPGLVAANNALQFAGAKQAPVEPSVTTIVVEGVGTKKEKAWAIIESMTASDAKRKDIVTQLVVTLGVNVNNASAYMQNYRKAHGMVTPRAVKTEE